MYENDWQEYDSEGLRHYLDRVLIESDIKLDYSELEKNSLDMFNKYRELEELDKYNLNEVSFDIVELDNIKKIEVRSIK
jgi:hypothetical protein